MWTWVMVGLGGGIGAILRYAIARGLAAGNWPNASLTGPWGIMVINVLGCFVFGLIGSWAKAHANPAWAPLLLTGVLGGFTTFSTFGWDTYQLLMTGKTSWAIGNAVVSVLAGIGAVALGVKMTGN